MKFQRFKVTEQFTTRLLGTSPASKEVYEAYINKKRREEEERRKKAAARLGVETAPVAGTAVEEVETIDEEAGITVFHNDLLQKTEAGEDGKGLFLLDYQVAGYWKETAEILQGEHGIKQPRSKFDNFVYIQPRRVYIQDVDGKVLQKADGRLERPLRAMTMRGPRVSLACSEIVNPGRWISYELTILPFLKKGSGREAKAVDVDWLVDFIASHGQLKGRGQWRNGGNGKFVAKVERIKS